MFPKADQVRHWLSQIGADITGVVPAAPWQQYLPADPPAGSVLLFGAGGPDFIRRHRDWSAATGHRPEHWLADYAQALFEEWHGGPSARYLNPYRSGLSFPFQRTAIAAGMGVMGLNHVVLNPFWGPWFSLLGAVLLTEDLDPTGPLAYDPCTGCDAPCLQVCPSGAVSTEGYDGLLCIQTKLTHRPCLHACPARHACVVRADLRREMVALEAGRPKDDAETRTLFEAFLRTHREGGGSS